MNSIDTDEWGCFDDFTNFNTTSISKDDTFKTDNNLTDFNTPSISKDNTFKSDDDLTNYRCVDCNSFSLSEMDNDMWCQECGTMQPKKLSNDAEYRFYGYSDNRSSNPQRVGMPTNQLLPEASLGSLIPQRSHDNSSMKRMAQYN